MMKNLVKKTKILFKEEKINKFLRILYKKVALNIKNIIHCIKKFAIFLYMYNLLSYSNFNRRLTKLQLMENIVTNM